jgi:hypothetical protein
VNNSYNNINNFFTEVLSELPCQTDTKAYIVGVFSKYKNATHDLSKESITIEFAKARDKQDFARFQNLGDWIFFTGTVVPNFRYNASEEYYRSIGRLSYYSCYRLIQRQWKLFEEMADNFITLEERTRRLLKNKASLYI